jgi:succinate-semialdehyde dehydrogenase / glutarate-semialdehyde dehydrogenase
MVTDSIYIKGEWSGSGADATRDILNPASGEVIATVGYGGQSDARAAVAAADQAFVKWSRRPVYERALFLKNLAEAIRGSQEKLARCLTREVGKPLPEASGEIGATADQFEWYAEEVKRSAGDVIPPKMADRRHLTIRHPVGPVAAISPWNFPVFLLSRKIAPALAAGCTVVCRPASQAPLTVIELFRLMAQVGLPAGTVNLVVGDPAACSRVFIEDERIKKISFTGSLEIGRELATACASKMKKVSLELGGHSPFIVMPDMPVDEAAALAVFSKYRNMGQVCISPSRFFVAADKKTAFEEEVVKKVSKLAMGDGLEPFTEVGPLFEKKRVDACLRFVEDIKARGGRILAGGKCPAGREFQNGFFFEPTVATDVTPEMLIMQEEPFVPILPIIAYETRADVIRMANDTPYGLAAYVLTNNLKWAIEMAESLEAGMIGINDCAPAAAHCPFGGMKHSGSGREGWRQGLEGYYETKYVSIGL